MTRRAAGASPFEADLEARIGALFRRCPTLCGFTVQDAASELFLTEVSAYPSDGPEARGELRERTFARILH